MMERLSHRTLAYRPKRLWRAALAASTCLSAVALVPAAARAQSLAPNTTPTGGSVAAGNASIAQAPGQTTINQSSQNAAINWQSFNVGSAAKVQFNQPDASATTLNRVNAQSPSVIAGRIDANGNIIIVNQSGIVFAKGSEVDAHGVIATTSNITDGNLMNGTLAFTGTPKPGAQIINDGHITVHDTGLVGLIAPQVANNGVITASLGQVILAGASAFTLDLYGDRLITLDVTKAVRAVDVGGKTVAALVTNSGLILADGGKITLTAADADALVTQLIDAGGTLRANSVGAATGTIAISGVGGNINIAGNLLAQGKTPGSTGGAVQALTDGTVNVAAGASISAAGDASGGVVALGTDLARATQGAADTGAPMAANVTVAAGAVVDASALSKGNAGTVTLLSADSTDFGGTIAVAGGAQGGNGGLTEISSHGVIALGGTVFDTAIDGKAGEVLLDPATLVVDSSNQTPQSVFLPSTNGGTYGVDPVKTSYVEASDIDKLSGTVVLEATSLISVGSVINMASAGSALSLVSGGAISVSAAITVNGSLEIDATTSLAIGGSLAATNILLDSGSGGIAIAAPISTTNILAVSTTGSLSEASGGTLYGGTLVASGVIGGNVLLTQSNSLAAFGSFTGGKTIALDNAGSLTLVGAISAPDIFLSTGTLSDGGAAVAITAGSAAAPGVLAIAADDLDLGATSSIAAPRGTIQIGRDTVGSIDIGVTSSSGTLGLPTSLTSLFGTSTADIVLGTASLGGLRSAAAATIAIDGDANFNTAAVTLVGPGLVSDNAGTLIAGAVALATGSFTQSTNAVIDAGLLTAAGTIADLIASGTANSIGTLSNVTATGTLVLTDATSLITGPLTAATAVLTAPTLAVAGSLSVAGLLTLAGLTGGATQSAGISAGTLAGEGPLAGGVSFSGANNSISSLGNLTLTGTGGLDVADTGTLALPGTIVAPGGLSLSAAIAIVQPGAGAITAGSANELALLLAPTINLAGAIYAPATGAEIALAANTLALTGTLNAALGAVAIAPFAPNTTIVVGGSLKTSTLALDPTELGHITADALLLGSITGVSASNTSLLILSVPLTTASELGLFSTNAVLETGTGQLTAAALVGAAGSFGLTGANSISGLGAAPLTMAGGVLTGGLSATGSLVYVNATTLDVDGAVAAGTLVSMAAPALTLSGSITAPTILLSASNGSLEIDGFISAVKALVLSSSEDVIAPGALSVGSLAAGSLGGALSLSGTNMIGTLGAISLNTGERLSVADARALTLAGKINASAADFTAPSLAIEAPITIAGELLLTSITGGVSAASAIIAGTLAGLGTLGNLTLAGMNTIAALGSLNLSSSSALFLYNPGSIDISGALTGGSATLQAGTIGIDAPVSLASLDLTGLTGGITQTSALTIGTLAGVGTLGGMIALDNIGNSIATLGSLALNGTLALADAAPLTIAGPLTASSASINDTSLAIIAPISITGELLLTSLAGALTDVSMVTIGQLMAQASGNATIALTGSDNNIGTIGNATFGSLTLFDDHTLTINGPLAATSVLLDAPGLAIPGSLTAGLLTLEKLSNGLTEAGQLDVGTLASMGSLGGTIALTGTNSIASLGSFTADQLDLVDIGGLTVGGDVDLKSATLSADTITQNAPLSITNTLVLADLVGGFTQTAPVTVGAVVGSLGGTLALDNAGNVIGTLGNLVIRGDLVLDSTTPTILPGTIAIVGNATFSGAGVSQTSNAVISVQTVSTNATIDGDFDLGAAGHFSASNQNTIAALGNATATGNLDIYTPQNGLIINATDLAQDITISANHITGAGTLQAGAFAAKGVLDIAAYATDPDLTLINVGGKFSMTNPGPGTQTISSVGMGTSSGSTISFGDSNTTELLITGNLNYGTDAVLLNTTGAVTQSPGVLTAAALTVNASGLTQSAGAALDVGTVTSMGSLATAILLTSPNNTISSLGSLALTSDGTLSVFDATALTIAVAIDPAFVTLSSLGSLVIDAGITAGTELLLAAGGSVIEDHADIVAPTLVSVGSIDGDVQLLAAGNKIGTLGAFTASSIELAETGGLTLAGPVNVNSASLSVGSLNVTGALTATSLILNNLAGGAVESGTLAVSTLSGDGALTGDVGLTGTNTIAALGNYDAANTTLADSEALDITGVLGGGSATIAAPSLAVDGAVSLTGALVLESLTAGFSPAGVIDVGTFGAIGVVPGDIVLNNAGDVIGKLGDLTVDGDLSIADQTVLDLTGALDVHNLIFAGAGVTQTSGVVTALTLSTDSPLAGALSLMGTAGNSISSLADIDVVNAFVLNNGNGALSLDGVVASNNITISTGTLVGTGILQASAFNPAVPGTVALSGALDGAFTIINTLNTELGPVDLGNSSPGVLILSGNYAAQSITGIIDRGNSFTTAITIAGDTTFGADDGTLITTGTISDEFGTLTAPDIVFDAAAFTQAAGAVIDVGTLTSVGTLASAIVLASSGNVIGTLGTLALAPTGTLSIADAVNLTIAAPINTNFVTLADADGLSIDAGITAGKVLALAGAGDVLESGGTVVAPTLMSLGSLAGDVNLTGPGNKIGTLGGLSATSLELAQAGSLIVAGAVTLASAALSVDTLAIPGSLSAGSLSLTGLSGGLTETGGVTIGTLTGTGNLTGSIALTGANSIGALGGFTANHLTLVDTAPLDITGPLNGVDATLSAPQIGFDAPVTLSDALALEGITAGATQTSGITAPTIFGIGVLGGEILLTGENSIGTLGGISLSTGVFALSDLQDLQLSGPLNETSGLISLAAPGIEIASNVAGITLGGGLSLTDLSALTIAVPLAVAGNIDFVAPSITFAAGVASAIGGGATLVGSSGIALDGKLSVGSVLELDSAGDITEPSGAVIAAQTLLNGGGAAGDVALLGTQNAIMTLGAFSADNFALLNGSGLTVAGALNAVHDVRLSDSHAIAIGAPIDAAAGTVSLISNGITLGNSGGGVTAGSEIDIAPFAATVLVDIAGPGPGLALSPSLVSALTAPSIVIGAAGSAAADSIVSDGAVSFGDALDLVALNSVEQTGFGTIVAPDIAISSPVISLAGVVATTGTLALATAGALTDDGTLSAGILTFSAASVVESLGGPITAGVLTGVANSGNIVLTNAGNDIASTGPVTAAGDFDLADSQALTVSAPVSAKDIDLADAAGISLSTGGSLMATFGSLSILSDALNAAPGATLVAATDIRLSPYTNTLAVDLGGTAADALDLSATLLAAVSAPTLSIATVGSLIVEGQSSLGTVGSLALGANGIDIEGGLTVPGTVSGGSITSAIQIMSTAPVTESAAGALTAGTLLVAGTLITAGTLTNATSLNTDVLLTSGLNDIGTLGDIYLGADDRFAIYNSGTLKNTAPIVAGSADIETGGTLILGEGHEISTTDALTLAAPSIALRGTIEAGTLLALDGATFVSEATDAIVGALTLSGNLPGASLGLTASGNSFDDIGSLTAASLSLNDKTPLTIAGLLSVTTATLATSFVSFAGNADVSGLLLFPSLTRGIAQSTGTIAAGTLASASADAGTISLGAPGNAISTLGAVTADSLLLADAGLLSVAGPVTVPTATFSAGTITLAGLITDRDALVLDDNSGGISQTAGSLNIGTLASNGPDAGPVQLTLAGNSIAALGAFTMAAGRLDLSTSGVLTLAGATSLAVADLQAQMIVGNGSLTGDNITLAAPGGINLKAPLTALTELTLDTGNGANVRETLGGAITTALLTTGTGSIGGNLNLDGHNSISTIANVSLPTGTITLNDVTGLAIDGLVSATAGSLTAAAIDLLTTGTLATTGLLDLANNGAGGITLAGAASVGSVLSILADGGFVETGPLDAATIALSDIGGDVVFGGAASFSTLAALSLGTNTLSIMDLAALTVIGPVNAAEATIAAAGLAITGSIATSGNLTLSAPSIGGAGVVNAGSILALENASLVSLIGRVDAGTITGGGTTLGNITLTGLNSIASISALTATGLLDVADQQSLFIAGPVTAASVTIAASALSLAGDLNAGSSLLLENLTGGVTQTAGALTAASFSNDGVQAGNINLQDADNNIGTLGNLKLQNGNLLLDDASSLTVGGPLNVARAYLSAPGLQLIGPVTATSLTLANAGNIGLKSDINAGTLLDFVNDGNVRETGAVSIIVATLNAAGAVGGNINLPGANTIGMLGTLMVPSGQVVVADNGDLIIAGPVSAQTVTITAAAIDLTGTVLSTNNLALDATAGGLTLPGTIGAVGLVSLASAGDIEQTGMLSGATLAGNGGGGTVLLDGVDSIASLGVFTAPAAAFTFADLTNLAITGPLSVASAGISAPGLSLLGSLTASGPVTLSGASGVALGGALNAGTTLALLSTGAITGTGALDAGTLTTDGMTDGAIVLADAQTRIASLSNISAASLNLVDQVALEAAGVTAPVLNLAAPSLSLDGNVTANSLFAVAAAGGVTQNAGILSTGLLTSDGGVDGSTHLNDAGNAIGTLGAYDVVDSGDLTLADATGLTVAGPVSARVIALSAPGLTLAGLIDAGSGLTLASTGNISQTGGLITAPTLSSGAGGIAGNLSLTQPNSITVLGTLADAGDLDLVTVDTLTLAAPVSAANVSLSVGGLDLNAPFTTGVLQIASTGPVTETGALTVSTLTTGAGTIAGSLVLNANNEIADLSTFAATGGLILNDIAALTLNGPVTLGGQLALNAAGVTQTAGAISAAGLTSNGGTITGNALFGQAGNDIPVLGNFAATGEITLADSAPLSLDGNITNGSATTNLLSAAALTQSAGVIATGLLTATGSDISLPDQNAIAALGNITTAGNLRVDGLSATTGVLRADNVSLTAPGAFSLGGKNIVAGAFDLFAPGALTQTNGSLTARAASLAASGISLTGTDDIIGDLSFTTRGDITHAAGVLDAGTLTGTAGQLASFAASTDFGTIGSFIMADSAFDLVNSGALSLDGPLVANTVSISASGILTLVGSVVGGLYVTGSNAGNTASDVRDGLDSVLSADSIQEIGSFYINNGPGSMLYNSAAVLGSADQAATIFLITATSSNPGGGPISLGPPGQTLFAPTTDVIVDGGDDGEMTGNVDLMHLEVLGGLDSEFTGTIDDITGQSAAGKANTFPVAYSRYQFNACPIGSVNCQIINIAAVPATNPLGNFDVTQRKRRRLDKNVQLPGIATHDF